MSGLMHWKYFWIFWLGGLAVFAMLVVTSGPLMTDVAPQGILDHQSATTAERVNAIQASWAALGQINYAKWSMIGDLVFIGLYMSGGIIGGRLIWQEARSPSLKKLGLFCVVAYFLFGAFDYTETISQIIQLLQNNGSDLLAGIAGFCQPLKSLSFVAGTIGMIAALIWRRSESRA
ncbi:hypothetical protein [Parasphingorhabdus halotolerans]|uniref:Uncharacterized protein n=1 Tax=Parasphingorhabdus halotolerans TaxID=2725558 RepID=A0A6H2DJE7_9SPHN|nr:hypothetical protein [Parasphingorhabdus halotolerans]QJB68318.1 hypothetical protein HF685_02530 [Parasphingorhabdus halotolerans]